MRLLQQDGKHSRFRLTLTGLFLVTFSFFYLLAFRYYHYASSRDPTSYFFNPNQAYERRYSAKRVTQAEAFIKSTEHTERPQTYPGETPFFCVGIPLLARGGEQFAHLTVGSLLAGLSLSERKDLYLTLLLAHTNASAHPVASETWMKTHANKVLEYDTEGRVYDEIKSWEDGGWHKNKTIHDYTYLLRECYLTGANFIIILEDDVIAMEGWYMRADIWTHHVREAMRNKPTAQEWVYLRLFYADALLGWHSEDWPKYLACSVLVWGAITGGLLLLRRRFRRGGNPTDTTIIGISIICVTLSVALYFMAGQHNPPPHSGVRAMNKHDCCAQALLFPRSIIISLLTYFDGASTDPHAIDPNAGWSTDKMIEKIADQQSRSRFTTAPPLMQHIGATDRKRFEFDEDEARRSWNFEFESWGGH